MSKHGDNGLPPLGFIGLGALGLALAERIDQKFDLAAVWNRSPEKLGLLNNDAIHKAQTIAELYAHCEWVFCCLSDDEALGDIVNAADESGRKPAMLISFSSCSPDAVKAAETTLASTGVDFLNVPVLGKPEIVSAGKAGYLVGGQSQSRQQVLCLLNQLGGNVLDLGTDVSSSAAIKLTMNFLIGSMIASFSEAFNQLQSAGMDPSLLLRVVENSPLSSPVAMMFGQAILSQAFTPGQFELKLARKDMQYFGRLSENAASLFVHNAILRHMEQTLTIRNTSFDWSGLAAHLFTEHQG